VPGKREEGVIAESVSYSQDAAIKIVVLVCSCNSSMDERGMDAWTSIDLARGYIDLERSI
jgi:hypothetical protein